LKQKRDLERDHIHVCLKHLRENKPESILRKKVMKKTKGEI